MPACHYRQLVNVDNDTLARLMANEDAMRALMSIEGFRSLNFDIETIINKSEAVKKSKERGGRKALTKEEKRAYRRRKGVQEQT